jgi:polyisoprenoid-binding protein YceI
MLLALLLAAAPALPVGGTVEVVVAPAGALKSRLHEHHFFARGLSGEVRPDESKVRVEIDAAQLKDETPELSAADRAKVEKTVHGPEVLDAAAHPTIVFESNRLEGGKLFGTLEIRGVKKKVEVPIAVERSKGGAIHARGALRFKQSDFGIRPMHKALGAIAVKDEVEVRFDLHAR